MKFINWVLLAGILFLCPLTLLSLSSEEISANLNNLRYLTNINGTLYFDAADSLYSCDGTNISEVKSDLGGITHWGLTDANGTIFFATHNEDTGKGAVWKSDGTATGTVKIVDGINRITGITHVGAGIVYYGNDNGGYSIADKTSTLYRTDGGTPTVIKTGITGQIRGLTGLGGTGNAFFTMYVYDDTTQEPVYELWFTDGTEVGTVKIKDGFNEDISYWDLADINGTCYFAVGFEGDNTEEESTFELWKSDGTANGTTMIKDGFRIIFNLTNVNGTLFFSTYTKKDIDDDWCRIWKSDGTAAGTTKVKDYLNMVYSGDLAAVGDNLYFADYNEDLEYSTIWKTDGTPDNTYAFEDGLEEVHDLVNVGGVLYYSTYSTAIDDEDLNVEKAPGGDTEDYNADLWKLQQGTATVTRITIGSVIQVNASDVDAAQTVFNKKPKVYGVIRDRTKEKSKAKNANMKITTKVSAKDPKGTVNAVWTKKLCLFNKTLYKGTAYSTSLNTTPINDSLVQSLNVLAKEFSDTPKQFETIYLIACPKITSVTGSYANEGDKFTVIGNYFGSKPPKIMVEYTKNGKTKYKKCKLDKDTALRFTDGSNKANKSCMKVLNSDTGTEALGYSEVTVFYPKVEGATGYIVIDNKVGLDAYQLP